MSSMAHSVRSQDLTEADSHSCAVERGVSPPAVLVVHVDDVGEVTCHTQVEAQNDGVVLEAVQH